MAEISLKTVNSIAHCQHPKCPCNVKYYGQSSKLRHIMQSSPPKISLEDINTLGRPNSVPHSRGDATDASAAERRNGDQIQAASTGYDELPEW
eukprot:6197574-Pleurochrysis_carterae.AAC.1